MKSIICPILVWLMVSAGHSQTNEIGQANAQTSASGPKGAASQIQPLPPGYLALTNLAKQKALVQQKIDKLTAENNVVRQRINLMRRAGQMGMAENTANERRERKVQEQIYAWKREIATLELQEFDLRQQYKIPQPAAARPSKRP